MEQPDQQPVTRLRVPKLHAAMLLVLAVPTVLLGIYWEPLRAAVTSTLGLLAG